MTIKFTIYNGQMPIQLTISIFKCLDNYEYLNDDKIYHIT